MISLYIHIPFCWHKCPYCSFPICVGADRHINSYLECINSQAKYYSGTQLETIYIGGGTPTCLNNNQIEKLVSVVRKNFSFSATCEWTIEANPETITNEKAKLLRDAGINRISIGVQSLNDEYLRFLGRKHNQKQAFLAFDACRKAGFNNINLDLMYSFPEQTTSDIQDDTRRVISFGSEHVSLYILDVEPGSKFYARRLKLQNSEERSNQYMRVAQLLENAGLQQYEISNFAKPKKESQHNIVYWRSGEYIGLGMAAHSHIEGTRSWNFARLQQYLKAVKEGKVSAEGTEHLEPQEKIIEAFLINLRMNSGVDIVKLQERFGCLLEERTNIKIEEFASDGLLIREGTNIKASQRGRLILDDLCARII